MPTENPFKFLDIHTNKGAAHSLAGVSLSPGQPDHSTLTTSGVFVDRETVTVDGDVYELVDLSTDSTVDILTFWNNTDQVITQTAIDPADYTFTIGQYVAVESEIAIVVNIVVNGAADWDVTFYRGVAGTTIAAHATGTTAIEVQGVTALTAGAITVPATGVTQALGLDALAAIIGNDAGRGPFESGKIDSNVFGVGNQLAGVLPKITSPEWTFYNIDDVTGVIYSNLVGSRGVTLAEAGANMVWDRTTTSGGSQPKASPQVIVDQVPTAADVTLGTLYFKFPFKVLSATAYVYTTATGAAVAWDGTANITDSDAGLVGIDNGGLVDWAATDTVVCVVEGAPIAVADLPAIR
jgi:hypothetical protein